MYLATVFYHKDSILVTAEDQIPLVEIQCCSTSITHDFFWFAKVNCCSNARPRNTFACYGFCKSYWAIVTEVAFLFLLQLSCAWQQVPWLQQALASAQSSSSSLLQNRHNILRAVSLLQVSNHGIDFPSNFDFLSVAPHIREVFATLASVFCHSSFLWRQTSLGTMDLGQVYYEPIKDRQGNILLVTLKDFINATRWERFTS